MFGIGMPELLIILVVALIVVGPKKLPDMAKGLGKGLSQFRKAADEIKEEFSEHETYQDLKSLNKSFRDTLDEVNPRKLLDEVNPLVEAKEPTLDLSGRDALMKEIKQQTEDPKEQATVEVAQPEAQAEAKPADDAKPQAKNQSIRPPSQPRNKPQRILDVGSGKDPRNRAAGAGRRARTSHSEDDDDSRMPFLSPSGGVAFLPGALGHRGGGLLPGHLHIQGRAVPGLGPAPEGGHAPGRQADLHCPGRGLFHLPEDSPAGGHRGGLPGDLPPVLAFHRAGPLRPRAQGGVALCAGVLGAVHRGRGVLLHHGVPLRLPVLHELRHRRHRAHAQPQVLFELQRHPAIRFRGHLRDAPGAGFPGPHRGGFLQGPQERTASTPFSSCS